VEELIAKSFTNIPDSINSENGLEPRVGVNMGEDLVGVR
jgi:hypothetical protein